MHNFQGGKTEGVMGKYTDVLTYKVQTHKRTRRLRTMLEQELQAGFVAKPTKPYHGL